MFASILRVIVQKTTLCTSQRKLFSIVDFLGTACNTLHHNCDKPQVYHHAHVGGAIIYVGCGIVDKSFMHNSERIVQTIFRSLLLMLLGHTCISIASLWHSVRAFISEKIVVEPCLAINHTRMLSGGRSLSLSTDHIISVPHTIHSCLDYRCDSFISAPLRVQFIEGRQKTRLLFLWLTFLRRHFNRQVIAIQNFYNNLRIWMSLHNYYNNAYTRACRPASHTHVDNNNYYEYRSIQ